ncbi:c-type cytochrome [Flavobacterium frigoris]|uniref:Copper-containing nitrite reductase n=1 Tax=Flavobacterium frigoris (strain PS1) TaxID=1086011 RepID=H7FNP2_FLAFP|nr:cytochrome c [Flavobacterium frigoris]EIA10031.1 copper-containing nitrite reductase [Flavobacterium frigoris PS1]
MLTSKLILGFAISLSSAFYFSNTIQAFTLHKESDYLAVAKVDQEKTALEKSIANGKEVYADFCMQCHLASGKGDSKNFPTLDGSDWLSKKNTQSIHAIKFGQSGEIVVNGKKFNSTMPSIGLSNQEVADVMNYIRNSWSNKNPKIISLEQVEAVKQ